MTDSSKSAFEDGTLDLTLKRFEQKYLLLSGFTFEVVQISPANTLYSTHL